MNLLFLKIRLILMNRQFQSYHYFLSFHLNLLYLFDPMFLMIHCCH
jgi:hypothetical protein